MMFLIPLYSVLLAWSGGLPLAQGFSIRQTQHSMPTTRKTALSKNGNPSPNHSAHETFLSSNSFQHHSQPSSTSLEMYNLPPSGGGGGGGRNNDNGLSEILTGAATLLGVVAFFASPLGGIFFSIVNSIVVLSILTPAVVVVGFQVWSYFNTLEGPCPNCGAPLRVVKEDDSPSVCLNCGTFVQATEDKTGIDFYYSNTNGQMVVDEDYQSSFLDTLFGGGAGRAPPVSQTPSPQERQSQYRRETTIIDIEVEDK